MDTNYTSLSEIDPEIVRFYHEEERQVVLDYDEVNEQPVVETVTVIVLDKPDKVPYSAVDQRRGERKPDDVVVATLEQAIEWEDFYINHDRYLMWQKDMVQWEEDQQYETVYPDGEEDGVGILQRVPAPERPVIDMANRRAVYFEERNTIDANLFYPLDEYDIVYDDDSYTRHVIQHRKPKPTEEVDAYYAKLRDEQALTYLAQTDWMVIRSLETGDPVPDEVEAIRESARSIIEQEFVLPPSDLII